MFFAVRFFYSFSVALAGTRPFPMFRGRQQQLQALNPPSPGNEISRAVGLPVRKTRLKSACPVPRHCTSEEKPRAGTRPNGLPHIAIRATMNGIETMRYHFRLLIGAFLCAAPMWADSAGAYALRDARTFGCRARLLSMARYWCGTD